MPTYEYECDKCSHHHEEFRGLSEPHPTKCPGCSEAYGDAYHQVYHPGIAIVYGQPTTVGQQAEINAKRVGKERLQEIAAEENAKRGFTGKMPKNGKLVKQKGATPWWRQGKVAGLAPMDKPLDLKKVANVQKYVETGETS
jgi:putative FmdB family regulatory protein